MVSIAIIGIVSAVVFANLGSRGGDLTRAAQALALSVRKAQNSALAPLSPPICVYGIFIQSSSYQLYRNTDPTCDPTLGVQTHNNANSSWDGSATILDGITILPSGVDIAFEPPEPVAYLNGQPGFGSNASTNFPVQTLMLTNQNGDTKSITVNRFGLVSVQ